MLVLKGQGGVCLAGKEEAGVKAQRHETARVRAATPRSERRWGDVVGGLTEAQGRGCGVQLKRNELTL